MCNRSDLAGMLFSAGVGAQFSTGGELIQSLSYDVDKQAFAAIDTELKLYLRKTRLAASCDSRLQRAITP